MSKTLVALVCAVLLSAAGSARAQSDALQTPALASARACLDRIADQGRKQSFDVERSGLDSLILDPSRDNIQMLQQSAAKCMDAAFPTMEVIAQPGSGAKSRAWYVVADTRYAWCATPAATDDINDIQAFGQAGPKQAWFALRLNCAIGDRIMNWYDPRHLKPDQADLTAPGRDIKADQAAPVASRPESVDCSQAAVHWSSAESIGTRQAYQDHLARFPNCAFATLAKVRIAAIDQGIAPPARSAVPPPDAPDAVVKNCPAGQVRDSDGDCVRERGRAPKNTNVRSARTSAPARPRASTDSEPSPPHALNCSDPAQVMACASKALGTLPH